MLRIDRHPLGPRVYVLGTRVHEWQLGAALLLALLAGGLTDRLDLSLATGLATFAGVWLVAKDWRDLVAVPARHRGVAARPPQPFGTAPRSAPRGSAPEARRPRRAPGAVS